MRLFAASTNASESWWMRYRLSSYGLFEKIENALSGCNVALEAHLFQDNR